MNPLTKIKLINELNEREANLGINEKASWHSEYKDSAWVFIGGFPYELSEGDVICVFSQYGEIVNINLVRDKKTGKSKGFCFLCYEDQRSTILAVDNLNGIKIKGRTIRVDHVRDYRPPKDHEDIDDITRQLREEGCAPSINHEPPSSPSPEEVVIPTKKSKKDKKEKKKKEKKKKKKASRESSSSSSSSASSPPPPPVAAIRVKEEEEDSVYDKYNHKRAPVKEDRGNGEKRRGDDDRRKGNEEKRRRGDDEERRRGDDEERRRGDDERRRRDEERRRRDDERYRR